MDLRLVQRYSKGTSPTVSEVGPAHYLLLKQSPQQQPAFLTHLHQLQGAYPCVHTHTPSKTDTGSNCPTISQQTLGSAWDHKEKSERGDTYRLHWNKEKGKQSAVASSEVKQKLHDFVVRKQQAALRQSEALTADQPAVAFGAPRNRQCLDPAPPQPAAPGMYDHVLNPVAGESLGHHPLRKTASEPNLKVRLRLKPSERRRKSPLLRRKDSAPASLRKRAPDSSDPSPGNSRSTSGGSSPTGAQLCDNEVRLTKSNITAEGPSVELEQPPPCGVRTQPPGAGGPPPVVPRSPVRGVPQMVGERDRAPARLHPVFILEPTAGHSSLLALTGIGTVPFLYTPAAFGSDLYAPPMPALSQHRPLGRTQSAPLPRSPKSIEHKLHTQQQDQLFLEKIKQQTHLGKLMTRLRHGEEGESERWGQGGGAPSDRVQSRTSVDRHQLTGGSTDDGPNRLGLGNHSEGHSLQVSLPWDHPWPRHLQNLPPNTETLRLLHPGVSHRPLSRARSSPASSTAPLCAPEQLHQSGFSTGLVYDSLMLKHQCACGGNNHFEHPGRIQSIWSRLHETGLRRQCQCIRGRKATFEEIQSVHTEQHVLLYGVNPLSRLKLDSRKVLGILSQRTFVMLPCGGLGVDSDTVWNENHTPGAARMAVGCTVELALKVASGQLKNGFAIVRPPGHHAEPSTAMGFCFFNAVAITAKQVLQKTDASKILIVDWDVHHGNSTQQVFYSEPNVLYISLHRHDRGNFFPGSGAPEEVGSGPGEGFNVNIAWSGGLDPPMGDAEYLAAFRTVVMPIAEEFSPDMVLVSSGFDAVQGHLPQMGGYTVSAKCFGQLTRELTGLADGRVVLVLEGGHNLTAICDASEACVRALLGKELEALPEQVLRQRPTGNAVQTLERVIQIHSRYWKSLQRFSGTASQSVSESQSPEKEESETVNALASLSVGVTTPGVPEKHINDEPMDEETST